MASEVEQSDSIIDSEIVEVEEQVDEDVPEESGSNCTINRNKQGGYETMPKDRQKLDDNSTIPDDATENYSEEFDDEGEGEETIEEVEEVTLSSSASKTSACKRSNTSSSSIRIHCEINISNSAVKSDQHALLSNDEDRTTVESSRRNSKDSTTGQNIEENKFSMEEEVRSWTPSDYNEESHLFDMDILNESMVNLLLIEDQKLQRERQHQQRMRYKNGTRMSLSFTNERMREIERHNQILVRKIFQQSASPQVMVSDSG